MKTKILLLLLLISTFSVAQRREFVWENTTKPNVVKANHVAKFDASGNPLTGFITVQNISATGTPSSSTFLRGDGTWGSVSAGGLSDGNYGDISISSGGTVFGINNLSVTNAKINDVAWSKITGVPAFGDVSTSGSYTNPSWITSLAWSKITSAPSFLTGNQTITLSGNITGSGTTSITTTIANQAVTYARMQNVSANSFLANATGSSATVQEISTTRIPLFASSITGTPSSSTYLRGDGSWTAIAGGGDVFGPASSTLNALARFDGATGKIIKNSSILIDDNANVFLNTSETDVSISPTGVNSSIDINITPKGNGTINIGSFYVQPISQTIGVRGSSPDNSLFVLTTRNASTGQAPHVNVIGGSATSSGLPGNALISGGSALSSFGNVGINTGSSIPNFQGMNKGLYIANASSNPTGNPVNGIFLYPDASDQSKLKYRTPTGVTYTLDNSGGGSGGMTNGGDATDANFTADVNSFYYLPSGTLTLNRTITIPTGSNGDVIELYNNEAGFVWNLAGEQVFFSDNTTVATSLLANTHYLIRKVSGKWRILN